MTTSFWDDVAAAFHPPREGDLREPELVVVPADSWTRVPPGWAIFAALGGAILGLAGLQTGVDAVRRSSAQENVRPLKDASASLKGRTGKKPGQLRRVVRAMDDRALASVAP